MVRLDRFGYWFLNSSSDGEESDHKYKQNSRITRPIAHFRDFCVSLAETGAGQHGVATATVCALMDMECTIYMGAVDVERQLPNVQRMKMLGAKVVAVQSGNKTLKDAVTEALNDWCVNPESFYLIGSAVGPHPYPEIVSHFQSVISAEMRSQLLTHTGREWHWEEGAPVPFSGREYIPGSACQTYFP